MANTALFGNLFNRIHLNSMMHVPLFWGLLLCFCTSAYGQPDTVYLTNPSFEDMPQSGAAPQGWLDAGFEEESPPDIQPGFFKCTRQTLHGNTYLALVTRDNRTWERVGQRLKSPLLKDVVYEFSLCLTVSRFYVSQSRMTHQEVNYDGPVRLRIWGVNTEKNTAELLNETPVVSSQTWGKYAILIAPAGNDVDMVVLEAYYGDPERLTNGNLLIDHCSPFIPRPPAYEMPAVKQTPPPFPEVFELYNASFEKSPYNGLPTGWEQRTYGLPTVVRTHPAQVLERFFISREGQPVYMNSGYTPTRKPPFEGKKYISLLCTDDRHCQAISQSLDGHLQKDSTYTFSVYLARSKHFRDQKPATGKIVDFKNPLKLRVWAGTAERPKAELMAESAGVFKTDWKKFEFHLKPGGQDYNWITLEAWYVSDTGRPYNGNLLLDACSKIVRTGR